MFIRSEHAEFVLGPPKPADPSAREVTLAVCPIGSSQGYGYGPVRTGVVEDVSLCGRWVLLRRDDVRIDERQRVAVMVEDLF